MQYNSIKNNSGKLAIDQQSVEMLAASFEQDALDRGTKTKMIMLLQLQSVMMSIKDIILWLRWFEITYETAISSAFPSTVTMARDDTVCFRRSSGVNAAKRIERFLETCGQHSIALYNVIVKSITNRDWPPWHPANRPPKSQRISTKSDSCPRCCGHDRINPHSGKRAGLFLASGSMLTFVSLLERFCFWFT